MLSAEDIKNVSFRRANFGGYKPEDVDAFVDDLQVSYDEILAERENLLNRIEDLNKTIEHYRSEDDAIRKILSRAQCVAEESLNSAEAKSSDMIKKANDTAKTMISEAEEEVSAQREISKRLKDESERLKNDLNEIYKKHMEIIEKIPGELKDVCESSGKIDILEEETSSEPSNVEEPQIENVYSGGKTLDNASKITDDFESKYRNLAFGASYDRSVYSDNNSGAYYGIFRKD